jgi:hypothetical protein
LYIEIFWTPIYIRGLNLFFDWRWVFFKNFHFASFFSRKNLCVIFIAAVASGIQAAVEMRMMIWTKQSTWLRTTASYAPAIISLMSVFFSFNYLLLPPLYLHILDISFFYIFSRIDPMFQAVVAEILQRIVKFVHILGSYYKGPISPLDTHSEPPSERLFFSIVIEFF